MNVNEYKKILEKQYNGSFFTAPWLQESIDRRTAKYAIGILSEAAELCDEQDVRTIDVYAAIEYLLNCPEIRNHIRAYQKALEITDPFQRLEQARFSIKNAKLRL